MLNFDIKVDYDRNCTANSTRPNFKGTNLVNFVAHGIYGVGKHVYLYNHKYGCL